MKNSEAKKLVDNFIENTEETRKTRAMYFDKYNKFVRNNDQWTIEEEPDEGKSKLTFNNSEDIIKVYKAKMFPRNSKIGTMEIGVKVFEKDKAKKEKYEKAILDTYDNEKLNKKVLEQAEDFLVGGSACFYYPQDPISKKAKIMSLDPRTVNIAFDDYGEIKQFAFQDTISKKEKNQKNSKSWLQKFINIAINNLENKEQEITRVTYWDKNQQIIMIGNQTTVRENKIGIIPVSWIPNNPKAHKHEGESEAFTIAHLDKEINFRYSDFSQRVKENTEPNLAVYSDKNTENINKEDKGILSLGQDDKAEFLTLTENKEALDYIQKINNIIKDKKAINGAITGELKSNISGLTMAYFFAPLLDQIGLKRIFWDDFFKELNTAILSYTFEVKKYKTRPVFESVMVSDETTQIDNTIKLLQNNLISYEDAIDELRGMENASEKLKEIIKEQEEYGEYLNNKKTDQKAKSNEEQYITL
ncbi:MAG: phage portal protein [Xanthomonadaceae bacterium]|nr:phage portal protein [Rhodospirillaceae bacterium]NIA18154.1 phage portal protein [Xanthomonadaceae bacterium]